MLADVWAFMKEVSPYLSIAAIAINIYILIKY